MVSSKSLGSHGARQKRRADPFHGGGVEALCNQNVIAVGQYDYLSLQSSIPLSAGTQVADALCRDSIIQVISLGNIVIIKRGERLRRFRRVPLGEVEQRDLVFGRRLGVDGE